MTIYINFPKDNTKPASLAIKDERLDDKDVIHLTEFLWALTDTKISIIGILGNESKGIEDYNDKSFKAGGQKVAFSFFKDENPVYDKDTKTTKIEPASVEQKVQFQILRTAMLKLQEGQKAVCGIAMMRPKVTAMIAGAAEATDEQTKAFFAYATKDMFVFLPREPELLTGTDTDFINALVAQKPGEIAKKSGGWSSTPKETEAERLQARWQFIQAQFRTIFGVDASDLPQLLYFISNSPEDEKVIYKAAFDALISLVSK